MSSKARATHSRLARVTLTREGAMVVPEFAVTDSSLHSATEWDNPLVGGNGALPQVQGGTSDNMEVRGGSGNLDSGDKWISA